MSYCGRHVIKNKRKGHEFLIDDINRERVKERESEGKNEASEHGGRLCR